MHRHFLPRPWTSQIHPIFSDWQLEHSIFQNLVEITTATCVLRCSRDFWAWGIPSHQVVCYWPSNVTKHLAAALSYPALNHQIAAGNFNEDSTEARITCKFQVALQNKSSLFSLIFISLSTRSIYPDIIPMATGFEVIGVALGLFPLVIEGVKFYISSAGKFKEMKHHKRTLDKFRRELVMEKSIFDNIWGTLVGRAGVPLSPTLKSHQRSSGGFYPAYPHILLGASSMVARNWTQYWKNCRKGSKNMNRTG